MIRKTISGELSICLNKNLSNMLRSYEL
jgi:hypothetical protein